MNRPANDAHLRLRSYRFKLKPFLRVSGHDEIDSFLDEDEPGSTTGNVRIFLVSQHTIRILLPKRVCTLAIVYVSGARLHGTPNNPTDLRNPHYALAAFPSRERVHSSRIIHRPSGHFSPCGLIYFSLDLWDRKGVKQ
ncbi:uncharacterized protein APUU_30609A [Aspergillus puulaauensis]|uniref:Uncharacterized protein n=1 Tax=Aspergillus puulaauensis TaxID=1220207 RepID=A0A7R7XJG4_9EURO|nr:uncharacterized protein APUU_30609A [Aspergillus puulaauensis]BCS22384.1 hypothetical protein APUU_30609A [Aspergillus puulaauensis]